MAGHKPFKQLQDQLESTPEGRAAIAEERRIVRDLLALYELRKARGVSEAALARAWNTSLTNGSRVEHERDSYISTLRTYVEALGGRLEISAVFRDQTVRLGADDEVPEVVTPAGQRTA